MENQTNTLFVNQSLLKMLFDIKKSIFQGRQNGINRI